jgi:hypothetical protein
MFFLPDIFDQVIEQETEGFRTVDLGNLKKQRNKDSFQEDSYYLFHAIGAFISFYTNLFCYLVAICYTDDVLRCESIKIT